MVDVSLEFLEEKQPHLSASTQGSSPLCGGCRGLPLQVSFLRSGQPEDTQVGRARLLSTGSLNRRGGTGVGTSCPLGQPVPFCGKDSVSKWFCPRHFCSRKITIFESNHPTMILLELQKLVAERNWEERCSGGEKGPLHTQPSTRAREFSPAFSQPLPGWRSKAGSVESVLLRLAWMREDPFQVCVPFFLNLWIYGPACCPGSGSSGGDAAPQEGMLPFFCYQTSVVQSHSDT